MKLVYDISQLPVLDPATYTGFHLQKLGVSKVCLRAFTNDCNPKSSGVISLLVTS